MEYDEILPCPHCGGGASLTARYSYKARTYMIFVRCGICGAQGKICSSPDNPEAEDWNNEPCNLAVQAWNMRTPPQGEGTQ